MCNWQSLINDIFSVSSKVWVIYFFSKCRFLALFLFASFQANNWMLQINKEIPEQRVKLFKVNIKDTIAIIWCLYWKFRKYFVPCFFYSFVDIVQVNRKMDCIFTFMKVIIFTSWYANVNVSFNYRSLQKPLQK